MTKIKYSLFLMIIAFAASCTERIDINVDDAPPRLVINGHISTDVEQHRTSVRITRSAGYFTYGSPVGVSHAVVTISDDDGNEFTLRESDEEAGLYQTDDDNQRGEEGKNYTLDVKVDVDGNAHHYRATAHLPPMNDVDSVRLRMSSHFEKIAEVLVFADFSDLPEENRFSVFVSLNDSVLNQGVDRVIVSSGILNGMPCYVLNQNPESERKNRLSLGDVVTVNINAITKEYADFISEVNSELRGSNPIFGGPPANVKTNIRCIKPENRQVSGFFAAFAVRYASVTVEEDFIDEIDNK